jgi:hypothetical protein
MSILELIHTLWTLECSHQAGPLVVLHEHKIVFFLLFIVLSYPDTLVIKDALDIFHLTFGI